MLLHIKINHLQKMFSNFLQKLRLCTTNKTFNIIRIFIIVTHIETLCQKFNSEKKVQAFEHRSIFSTMSACRCYRHEDERTRVTSNFHITQT